MSYLKHGRAACVASVVAGALVFGSLTWINLTPKIQRFAGSTMVNRGWPLIGHSLSETRFQPKFRSGLSQITNSESPPPWNWQAVGFDAFLAVLLSSVVVHAVMHIADPRNPSWHMSLRQLFLFTGVVAVFIVVILFESQIWRGVGRFLNCPAVYPQDNSWRQPLVVALPVLTSIFCLILRLVNMLKSLALATYRRLLSSRQQIK